MDPDALSAQAFVAVGNSAPTRSAVVELMVVKVRLVGIAKSTRKIGLVGRKALNSTIFDNLSAYYLLLRWCVGLSKVQNLLLRWC